MSARRNEIRIKGEVPADYAGPVYHGVGGEYGAPNNQTRLRIRVDTPTSALLFHDTVNIQKRILTHGSILDADGELLPQWRTPLKGEIIGNGQPDRIEFDLFHGAAIIISERVHDAIVTLEPDRHIFIAIDAAGADKTHRYYAMYSPHAHLWGDAPLLHPAKNGLVQWHYENGHQRWDRSTGDRDAPPPFEYLDGRRIEDRHLFTGSLLSWILSPALFERLAAFGDIFRDAHVLVPMGVCWDDDADYVPPIIRPDDMAPRRSFLGRLFGR